MTQADSNSADERNYPRVPKEVGVEVTSLGFPMPSQADFTGNSLNIGINGICFMAERDYEIGTPLNLKIDLKGLRKHISSVAAVLDAKKATAPLSVVAKVSWTRPGEGGFEVGAEFVNVYEDEHKALSAYLNGDE